MLGTEERPLMMQTSTFIPKSHFILLVPCPKYHRSDTCILPLLTWVYFLEFVEFFFSFSVLDETFINSDQIYILRLPLFFLSNLLPS